LETFREIMANRPLDIVLYVVSLLILVRSVFGLIEYAGGSDGYLISHELFLYIFDALLVLGVLVVLISFILPRSFQERLETVEDALSLFEPLSRYRLRQLL
jgi:hypothetical protein